MHYLRYLFFYLVLILLLMVIENPQDFGLSKLAKKIEIAFKQEEKILIISEYTEGSPPTTSTVENKNLQKGEKSWLTSYKEAGRAALNVKEYQVTFDVLTGKPKTYTLIREEEDVEPMSPITYVKGSKVVLQAYFNPKFSRYGVNCKGCSGQNSGHGNFGVGIGADIDKGVRQFSGKYQKGITFEGYYIVAADPAIPYCTILEISNHNFKGGGLSPGVPFYAVVLDRGGAIKKNRLDFYIGDERYYNDVVKYSGRRRSLATIIAFGKRALDNGGQRSCKLPKIDSLGQNAKD